MNDASSPSGAVRIALIQDTAHPTKPDSIREAERNIREAARNGAKIVCTQELFLTEYFCWKQDPAFFDLADPVPGDVTRHFQKLAAELNTVLILSLFEHRAPGIAHNTAVVIDADGAQLGIYRKVHIPQDPGFEEKFYFTPGDIPFRSFHTKFADIGVIICWDQWYPESARLTALAGAQILFCPTAIGGIAVEPPALWRNQRKAWLNVQCGHPVANGCFYAAANRVGTEHGTRFWGTSFVADFYGNKIALAGEDQPEILYADCDLRAMEQHRRMWPFFRDRRTDVYGPILEKFHV